MPSPTRRRFLQSAAAVAGSAFAAGAWAQSAPATRRAATGAGARLADRYVTCFYQFGKEALAHLSGPSGLPNGPRFLHIFSHSGPGTRPRPELTRSVHACGSSFKHAIACDVHKYKGWQQGTDEQLKEFAKQFREQALGSGPADYFAFNEMPTVGAEKPALREKAAAFIRYIHDLGGGPKLRGVFYFTEKNLDPKNWVDSGDDFWAAIDETCDVVVGEHYHNHGFVFSHTVERYADHLFALPKWLEQSGKPAQVRVAREKYAVLHSSYYGPKVTGWAGLQNDKFDGTELENYFKRCVAATRASEYGRNRISFGPLALAKGELGTRMLPALTRVLAADARAFGRAPLVPSPGTPGEG